MDVIAFTQRVEVVESYNERRDCADQRISEFVSCCGYLPVPLPNRDIAVDEYMRLLSPAGIVLTGGNSLVKCGGKAPERDEMDKALIRYALDNNIPLLGFCRGMQSILDFFGEKLESIEGHVAVRHIIRGYSGCTEVNSFHNQGCVDISSDELEATMWTDDGVVEQVKHRKASIVGIMWHPEREGKFRSEDVELLRGVVRGGKHTK